MRIALLVEGETERVFLPFLRVFLADRVKEMPKLDAVRYKGRIPKADKLKRDVQRLLTVKPAADYVIALTDVYTDSRDFVDAENAKSQMRSWCPDVRFFPHAAQYEFEAWLLPYWEVITKLARSNRKSLGSSPENVNHDNPPSRRLSEVFRTGNNMSRKDYVKVRDAASILQGQDLSVAANACLELKAFLNTILNLCGGQALP